MDHAGSQQTDTISAAQSTASFYFNGFGLRFVGLFLAIFAAATLAWSGARGTALERLVVEQATVATSARLISWVSPAEGVRADGFRLISPRVRLSVLNGCEGTESILLLAAAVLAFPAPWRKKPAGLILGALGVFLLNQARIVGLYFILRYRPTWFEAMHGYIAPTLIILTGSLIFILWLRWAKPENEDAVTA
jgi:exosortase family protein XrtM